MNNDTHKSVINWRWVIINGRNVMQQLVRFSDGRTEWQSMDEPAHISTEEFEARFNDTETIPADFNQTNTDVLVAKETKYNDIRGNLLIEHMDKILKLHALLIRFTGGQPADIVAEKRVIDFKSNTALKECVILLIGIVDEPWTDVLPLIK
jgi:hypothetical protein